jgi:hypothetical protein
MAVHLYFAGFRGVVAPVVAFYLVSGWPLNVLGWISVGLIVVGSAFLVPEIKFGRNAQRGVARFLILESEVGALKAADLQDRNRSGGGVELRPETHGACESIRHQPRLQPNSAWL